MSEQLDQSTIRDIKLLEAKVHQLSMQVQRALAEQTLDGLEDGEVKYLHPTDAPQGGWVWTWDDTVSTPYGGLARFAPSVAGDIAVTQALASYDDDGLFDEISPFYFQPSFLVNANSYQLVIVTAYVDGISDIEVATGVSVPTPWRVEAFDSTGDPGAALITGGMGTGSGRVSFPLWLHNGTDTDTDTGHNVDISVEPVAAGYEFDATVTVRAESVFQMAAIP